MEYITAYVFIKEGLVIKRSTCSDLFGLGLGVGNFPDRAARERRGFSFQVSLTCYMKIPLY